MSGWTVLCLWLATDPRHAGLACAIAFGAWLLNDSPRQRCDKLEARIKALEAKR